MHKELQYGEWKYLTFLLFNLLSLVIANYISCFIYIKYSNLPYSFVNHLSILVVMLLVDVAVTFFFSSLRRVLRWKISRDLYETARHIFYCFIILVLFLFVTKSGADYSRAIVLMAYLLDFLIIVLGRAAIREIFIKFYKRPKKPTVMLMTTNGFVNEGIKKLSEIGYDVKYIFLIGNTDKTDIKGIPVVKEIKEAISVLCWKLIDKVYIYGIDRQMVPEYLTNACEEMTLPIELVDFSYRVVYLKTIEGEQPNYGKLTFLESKRDIPFPIRRAYWITETEANLHRGMHAHKLNCQLLFCPNGVVDIILDDGRKRNTVTLDRPDKGLILMPGLWREMVWKKTGSVLCVLASEYYDEHEYIRNYNEFIAYSKKYRESATDYQQQKEE